MRILFWLLLIAVLTACDGTDPQSPFSGAPADAELITTDVDHFWTVVDAGPLTEGALQRGYFDRGTVGLTDFARQKNMTATSLASTYRQARAYYQATRPAMERIGMQERAIRAAFEEMERRYPDAIFPDVYFLVGQLSAAGRTSPNGLLIGTEMVSRSDTADVSRLPQWLQTVLMPPDRTANLVAHELVHYQQRHPDGSGTLLRKAVIEGAADFIAELISGAHINDALHAWAEPREAALWAEFQKEMHQTNTRRWLYNGGSADRGDRPADLGYWMGYQIVEAYYHQADDKKQAVADILTIQDFPAFLEKSGYAPPSE